MTSRVRGLILPAIFVLAAIAILVSLGNWQLDRLAWKEALIASATERPAGPVEDLPPLSRWPSLDVGENAYRPFRLSGRFLHEQEALVFTSLTDPNGSFGGPGYWVVTPFQLSAGGVVLVNRGFVPQGRHLPADRSETLGSDPVVVTGLLRPDDSRSFFTPADRPDQNIFYARKIEAIAAAKNLPEPVAPFTIDLLADATPPGGLPQAGETRMVFTNNHLGYALTWYGLAGALLAVFLSFAWTRLSGRSDDPRLTAPGGAP
ncbi:MAG TPA: SURF1 family protein [Propylenella sp.]|nr:SURF1 family protein [Propylenella sp.]